MSKPQTVTPAQAQQWMKSGEAVLIDVRQPEEHARERIAGSTLMPLPSFDPAKAAALGRPGQKIVLHCKGGTRSAEACRACAAGGGAAYSMAGGIENWKQQGLPVEMNTKVARLSIMRQMQLVVGVCVLAGCALAWFVHPAFVGIPAFFGAGLTFAGASGFCGMAALLGLMPWNKAGVTDSASCSTGKAV